MERTILNTAIERAECLSVERQLPCLLICEPGSHLIGPPNCNFIGILGSALENWIHETSIGWKSKNLRQDGACMSTCKKSISLPSLLPEEVKQAWDQKQVDLALRSAALVACFLITVMLVVAFIQKSVLWDLKSDLLEQLDSVEAKVGKSLEVFDSLKGEYQMLRLFNSRRSDSGRPEDPRDSSESFQRGSRLDGPARRHRFLLLHRRSDTGTCAGRGYQ